MRELSILGAMLQSNRAAGLHNKLLALAFLKAQAYEIDHVALTR